MIIHFCQQLDYAKKKTKQNKNSSCSQHPSVIEQLHPPPRWPPALFPATVPASLDKLNASMFPLGLFCVCVCVVRWLFYLILPNGAKLLWNICWLHLKCNIPQRWGGGYSATHGDRKAPTAAVFPGSFQSQKKLWWIVLVRNCHSNYCHVRFLSDVSNETCPHGFGKTHARCLLKEALSFCSSSSKIWPKKTTVITSVFSGWL